MSNGTSKQSGVGKFLSGPLGGVAVQGGLGLIGGILGGIGERRGIKAQLPGMQDTLAGLQQYGSDVLDQTRDGYGGVADVAGPDFSAARGASRDAIRTAEEALMGASGGRVEGSQLAFDQAAEAQAEQQGVLRRSAGDVTDVLQAGALQQMLANRERNKMARQFAQQGQANQRAAEQALIGARQAGARQDFAMTQAEFNAQRQKDMMMIQGDVNLAELQMNQRMAELQQQSAIDQTRASMKGSLLRGIGAGLAG